MSQPLTGQVRQFIERRHDSLTPAARLLLWTLADMIPKGRVSWVTTWGELARQCAISQQWIEKVGRKLARRNIISIKRHRYGITIGLAIPDRSLCDPSEANPDRSLCDPPDRSLCDPFDSPPYNPPAGTPQTRVNDRGQSFGKIYTKERGKRKSHPPFSPEKGSGETTSPHVSDNGTVKGPLRPAERISLEREIEDLQRLIREIRAREPDPDCRCQDDRDRLKAYKARVDENCARLGRLPIFRKPVPKG